MKGDLMPSRAAISVEPFSDDPVCTHGLYGQKICFSATYKHAATENFFYIYYLFAVGYVQINSKYLFYISFCSPLTIALLFF